MSHAGVQADSTGRQRGAAVSFATKAEAIAFIAKSVLSLTVDEADLLEPLPRAAYTPWIVPLTAQPNDAAGDAADD
jgi:hypothetical protein